MKYSEVKAYKYKLEENFMWDTGINLYYFDNSYYKMYTSGTFLIKKSYSWDGSSVPHKKVLRFASLGFYDPDRYCKEASLIHDGLCQAMREGLLPKKCKLQADLLYEKMCVLGYIQYMKKKKKKVTKKKLERAERWAKRRYWALREFGAKGIELEKHPRNTIYDTEKVI